MNHRLRTFLRSVLMLTVAVGPLQAQTVFACSMMDMVMEECCCDDHGIGKECIDSDCETAVGSSEEPCCEQSVAVQVDEDAQQDTRVVKPLEIRSDVVPPQAIVASFNVIAAPQERSALVVYEPRPIVCSSGTDTYLITQLLRI